MNTLKNEFKKHYYNRTVARWLLIKYPYHLIGLFTTYLIGLGTYSYYFHKKTNNINLINENKNFYTGSNGGIIHNNHVHLSK